MTLTNLSNEQLETLRTDTIKDINNGINLTNQLSEIHVEIERRLKVKLKSILALKSKRKPK